MARGKHKTGAINRRRLHIEATLDQLHTELKMEQAALAEAEQTLEVVTHLQSDLKTENAALAEEVTPHAGQLRQERDFLRSVSAGASGHETRVSDAWNDYLSVAIDQSPGTTGLERTESLIHTLGLNGWLGDSPRHGGANPDVQQMTRIQRARGERRRAAENSPEESRVSRLETILNIQPLMPAMMRPSYRQRLIDEGVILLGEGDRHHLRDPAELTAQQNTLRDEAIGVAQGIWQSHAGDLNANAVLVWGSGGLVSAEGPVGESRLALGFADETETTKRGAQLKVAVGLPLASMPAASRRAIALHSAETILGSWRGVFESRRLIAEKLGLSSHPFAPLAHHPQPSQGLTVQNAYALAAFSSWLHLETGGAFAETATGLTAAAAYWLPAGQTASFAESEPMDESDRTEMILPFPQVFLAFAEPLVIDPTADPSPAAQERWRVLSQITHDTYRGDLTAGQTVEDWSRQVTQHGWSSPTVDAMISELGAHIEGVLLLADSLGRPEDLFAWCLTVPGAYGSTLGRFVVPARRSATEYRDVIDNLTAVVAWAQWHEPDQSTAMPLGIAIEDLRDHISSRDFQRNAKRAGAGVRVVDVGSTNRGGRSHLGSDRGESDVHVTPHIRRGHWRRQRFGQGLEQSRRIRIAPVLVNAQRGDIAPRVYRLRRGARVKPPEAEG